MDELCNMKVEDVLKYGPLVMGIEEGPELQVLRATSDGVTRTLEFSVRLFGIELDPVSVALVGNGATWSFKND